MGDEGKLTTLSYTTTQNAEKIMSETYSHTTTYTLWITLIQWLCEADQRCIYVIVPLTIVRYRLILSVRRSDAT